MQVYGQRQVWHGCGHSNRHTIQRGGRSSQGIHIQYCLGCSKIHLLWLFGKVHRGTPRVKQVAFCAGLTVMPNLCFEISYMTWSRAQTDQLFYSRFGHLRQVPVHGPCVEVETRDLMTQCLYILTWVRMTGSGSWREHDHAHQEWCLHSLNQGSGCMVGVQYRPAMYHIHTAIIHAQI